MMSLELCGTSIVMFAYRQRPAVHLTPAENNVASMLVRDMKSEEISTALGITHNIMQTHRRNVLAKVRVRGVAGLVRWWDEYQREKLATS